MAGSSSVRGDQTIYHTDNICFDGTDRGSPMAADGQLWIGATASNRADNGGHVRLGALTSPLGTLQIGYDAPDITLDITGGSNAIERVALQTGTSPIVPTGGTITFNGAVVAAGTNPVRTDGTGPNTMALEVQISQALAATDATKIGLSNFDSADFSVDANGFVTLAGGGAGQTITGNTGGALAPTLSNWNIVTLNSTPVFAGAVSTLTVDFSLENLVLGSSLPVLTSGTDNVGMGPSVMGTITSGSQNVGIGNLALQTINSGSSNVVIGFGSGRFLTSGNNNTFVGAASGDQTTTGGSNTAVGSGALDSYTTGAADVGNNAAFGASTLGSVTTGTNNTAIGTLALSAITIGVNNIALGLQAGSSHTVADSSNIDIGNLGTLGDSNTIRIGTQGSGTGQQLQTHIAGVLNTVSGRVVKVTTPGAYPYTTLTTDYLILVDSSSARSIVPLASPVTGTTYIIKDSVGSAGTNNITVTPSGKNIDGAASFVLNVNYGSITIIYNGSEWSII